MEIVNISSQKSLKANRVNSSILIVKHDLKKDQSDDVLNREC